MNTTNIAHKPHGFDGTTKPRERAYADYMTPARHLSIIRARARVVDELTERALSATDDEIIGTKIELGLAHADIVTHLTWLEDEGHLKTFQELLMAETEVAR